MKTLYLIFALWFALVQARAGQFNATNDLTGPVTLALFSTNAAGQFTLGGTATVLAGTNGVITAAGTNWNGVVIVNTNNWIARLENYSLQTNGANVSFLVTNGAVKNLFFAGGGSIAAIAQASGYTNLAGAINVSFSYTTNRPGRIAQILLSYRITDTNNPSDPFIGTYVQAYATNYPGYITNATVLILTKTIGATNILVLNEPAWLDNSGANNPWALGVLPIVSDGSNYSLQGGVLSNPNNGGWTGIGGDHPASVGIYVIPLSSTTNYP